MDEVARHNRRVMLNRVQTYWLKGVLEESLHGGELIDLGLAYRPSALAGSQEPAWQQTSDYDIPLPLGTKISTVFAAASGELLVLGEPGAGKTTMLLQLVSDLLAYAEQEEDEPIPAVFSLANWTPRQELDAWLVQELANNYEVPQQLSRIWIANKQFIPLLDGLDEVEVENRNACTQAINRFREAYPGVQMLVTTRSRDYQALETRLELEKAIVLQPLNEAQIDAYLASRGPRLIGLRAALYKDATLRELAQSPLMLSIMTLAYYRMPADVALALGNREAGHRLLFEVYVERMSRYRGGDKEYAPQGTQTWLSWLAKAMDAHSRTMFFLENMQPAWLPPAQQDTFVHQLKRSVGLLFLGAGFVAGLAALPAYGLAGPAIFLALGLVLGLATITSGRLTAGNPVSWRRIETAETLVWSWPWAGLGMLTGGVTGLLLGAALTWLDARGGSSTGVPWWLLGPVLLGVAAVLDRAVLRSEVKIRTAPGLGIQRSRQNGLLVAGATVAITALLQLLVLGGAAAAGLRFSWTATVPWLIAGALFLTIAGGLAYGGLASLMHRQLQAQLQRLGAIPAGYVHFLDYAAERSLLRKVGGGYTFMHALLLDYFKEQEVSLTASATGGS